MTLTTDVGLRKAAVLMIQLGQDRAGLIAEHLHAGEVERISAQISQLESVEATEADTVLHEFSTLIRANAHIARGGPDLAKALLEERMGVEQAHAAWERLNAGGMHSPFGFLNRVEPAQVLTSASNQHPQIIAMILAHMATDRATEVFAGLDPALKADVGHRIGVMKRPAPEILERLAEALEHAMANAIHSSDTPAAGGVHALVDILTQGDRASESLIIENLESSRPELAEEIKEHMFVFDNIADLDDSTVQKMLRMVDTADLGVALKGTDVVLGKVTKNMSSRARTTLLEDMELLGPVHRRKVEAAQHEIVRALRALEQSDEVVLRRGRDEAVIA